MANSREFCRILYYNALCERTPTIAMITGIIIIVLPVGPFKMMVVSISYRSCVLVFLFSFFSLAFHAKIRMSRSCLNKTFRIFLHVHLYNYIYFFSLWLVVVHSLHFALSCSNSIYIYIFVYAMVASLSPSNVKPRNRGRRRNDLGKKCIRM